MHTVFRIARREGKNRGGDIQKRVGLLTSSLTERAEDEPLDRTLRTNVIPDESATEAGLTRPIRDD
jgi:hypothetical protein